MTRHTRHRVLLVVAVLLVVGVWYRATRPAASLKETIGAIGRPDTMSVEAIAEGGSSIVGRNVSITNARVIKVSADRSFWISGDEGPPLLVIALPAASDGMNLQVVPSLKVGDRVQINGVVRDGPRDGLSDRDKAQLEKASVYVMAAEVLRDPPKPAP